MGVYGGPSLKEWHVVIPTIVTAMLSMDPAQLGFVQRGYPLVNIPKIMENLWKSPFLMGKSAINGQCSIAMWVCPKRSKRGRFTKKSKSDFLENKWDPVLEVGIAHFQTITPRMQLLLQLHHSGWWLTTCHDVSATWAAFQNQACHSFAVT